MLSLELAPRKLLWTEGVQRWQWQRDLRPGTCQPSLLGPACQSTSRSKFQLGLRSQTVSEQRVSLPWAS